MRTMKFGKWDIHNFPILWEYIGYVVMSGIRRNVFLQKPTSMQLFRPTILHGSAQVKQSTKWRKVLILTTYIEQSSILVFIFTSVTLLTVRLSSDTSNISESLRAFTSSSTEETSVETLLHLKTTSRGTSAKDQGRLKSSMLTYFSELEMQSSVHSVCWAYLDHLGWVFL